jgi:integrating conjugative element protein (TIGR03749 family)
MKHPVLRTLIVLCAVALLSPFVNAVELLRWERVPLSVPLRVDEERVIFIDRNVRVGADRAAIDRLRLQSAGGVIYVKALGELPPSRLQVQVIESSEIILIDVYTVDNDSSIDTSEAIRIVDGRSASVDEESVSDGYAAKVAESLKIPAPVALTRYASQSLYAPLRTVEPTPGLRKVGLISDRLRLFPTEPIAGYPLVAYRLGSYTVSAVKLVNTSPEKINLDPRKLSGDFYSATFQHTWIGKAGTPEDTTVVYLITKNRTLEQSLLPGAYKTEAKEEKGKQKNKKAASRKEKES